jgi:hypothetical protein
MTPSDAVAAISLLFAAGALYVSLRERAAGPRAALYQGRLEAVTELAEAMWSMYWPPVEGVNKRTAAANRLIGLVGKWSVVLDDGSIVAVRRYAAAIGLGSDEASDLLTAATASLRAQVSAEPLSEALAGITGQAGRARSDAFHASVRADEERIMGPAGRN